MLEAQGLRKAYGERTAVAGVSLSARAGEILGLLGPNGAGKSTTVGMIAGLTRPDAGSVTVGGSTLAADEFGFKRRVGLVPQDLALFEDLPALANIELFGALYGLPKTTLKRRAMFRRRFIPPLKVEGLSRARSARPTISSTSIARLFSVALGRP